MEEKSPSEGDKTDCKAFVDLTSQPLSNTDSMSTGSNRSQQNLMQDYQGMVDRAADYGQTLDIIRPSVLFIRGKKFWSVTMSGQDQGVTFSSSSATGTSNSSSEAAD